MKESPQWETVPRDLWMNVAFCPMEIPRNLGTEGTESMGELRQRHLMLQLFPKVTEIQLPVSWERGSHLLCSELVGACAHMEALGSWGTLQRCLITHFWQDKALWKALHVSVFKGSPLKVIQQ